MTWAPCICRTIFSRCAPRARLTTHLRTSVLPTTRSRKTSWTTTARDRLLGTMAHVIGEGQTLVKAIVGVMIVACDGDLPHDVYGTITATTTARASGEPLLRYTLFHKVKGEAVHVPEGTAAIPLQREHVPAPLCSQLQVSARLRCLDKGCYYGGDDEIADGSVVFLPSLYGADGAVIRGKHGKVRVDVTWSPF